MSFFQSVVPFTNANIVVDGNSLSTSDIGTSYLIHLVNEFISSYSPTSTNKAVSGQTTSSMMGDASFQIDPLIVSGKRNVLIAYEVGNDVRFLSNDYNAAYANIVSYCNARRAAGWEVITLTCMPRTDISDSYLVPANSLMMANWFGFCDGIIDLRLDVRLTDINNTVYFNSDKVHTNSVGNRVIAENIYKKLKDMYAIV